MEPLDRDGSKYQVRRLGLEDYRELTACQSACPVGTDTKRYVRAIAEGDYERAYLIARQTNPLVSVCSRVCTAPCEKACMKSDGDGPVGLRALKRFACDQQGASSPLSVVEKLGSIARKQQWTGDRTGSHILNLAGTTRRIGAGCQAPSPRIAVVGSGPAGLSAAHDLSLLGYAVTIFEGGSRPGGQLMTGIPGFRLPKDILRREIETIQDLGVEIRLNTPIGGERSLSDLLAEGFEAVFVAIGLQGPMTLKLEGADLSGVHAGIHYVRDYEKIPMGRTCMVIGGGGVAIDCAQHAVRQGAQKVMVACLESWETMPASLGEREDAREEGIEFLPSLGPQRILGRKGRVSAVEFLKVASVLDSAGNFNPSYFPHGKVVLEAETVILAVGQSSLLPSLPGMKGLETTPSGLICTDDDLSTNLPAVFAGGDIRRGAGRSATEAIAEGQRGARAIHGYLSGEPIRVRRKGVLRSLGREFKNIRCDSIGAAETPRRSAGERILSGEEIALAFEEGQARRQAERCRRCNIQILFDPARCLLCGTCVNTCVTQALKMVRTEDLHVGRNGDPDGSTPSPAGGRTAVIKDESRCARCGTCSRRCPAEALSMAEFHCEEDWEEGAPGVLNA